MRVLFLNMPTAANTSGVRDLLYGCWCGGKRIANASYPPLDLLYLATDVEKAGFAVRVVDSIRLGLGIDKVAELTQRWGADMVVCSTFYSTLKEDTASLRMLKKGSPSLKTIVYGICATFEAKSCLLQEGVDFIIQGEPEFAIVELLKRIESKEKYGNLTGIGFKEKGRIQINVPRESVSKISVLPIPNRDLLPELHYFNPLINEKKWTTVVTSRGCPSKCSFCFSPKLYGGSLKRRPTTHVLDELRFLKEKEYKEVFFRDETFTADKKSMIALCKGMISERMNMKWVANAKVGTVDRKTLGLMKEAGCEVLKIGVESGNQKILDNIKKGITLMQTEDTFRWTKEAGIRTHAHFMLGCPGETKETIRETIDFAKKIGPDTATFGILTPYPGTEIFESIKNKIKGRDYSGEHTKAHYNELFTELKQEELEKALKQAYREFYFRPGYVLGRLKKVRSVGELKNLIKSGLAVTGFAGS